MRYNLHGKGVPFQQIALTLSINFTEIGTLCPKITQQSQKILLSNLCSPLYAHAVTFPLEWDKVEGVYICKGAYTPKCFQPWQWQ